MKKRILYVIGSLILTCATLFVFACKKPQEPAEDIGEISLNRMSIELIVGNGDRLSATAGNGDARFEWASSDPSVATVDENGNVTAVRAGTATVTASYKTKSASCVVNVSLGGFLPSIEFDNLTSDSVKVDTANAVNLAASVLFNGKLYSDASVEYALSDPSVGSVTDGVFAPAKVGRVTVTATASWRGVESEFLSKSITVEVIHRFETLVSGMPVPAKIELFTVSSFAGKAYATEADFDLTLKIDGTDVSSGVAIEVEDTDKAIYDAQTKKLTAKNYGETKLTFSYSDGGDISVSQTVEIFVARPVAKYPETAEWFSALDGELKNGSGENLLTKEFGGVIESATQNGKALDVSQSGKILGVETSATEKTLTQITVNGDKFCYIFDVEGYTMVIDEPNDLKEIELSDNKKVIRGYFILADDIDASVAYPPATTRRHRANSSSYLTNGASGGFQGTFDGNGHKIDKLCINNSWGFFGCGGNLTVKDLAFTNVDASGSNVAILFGTWCGHAYAPLYIENVYAQINTASRTQQFGIFRSARNGQVKVNDFLLEINTAADPCTATAAVNGMGMFRSDQYSVDFALSTDSWAYMGSEMQNMYIVSAPNANGRVLPLVQYKGVSVYASNDYAETAEATAIKFENNAPVADASGTDKIYHYRYATRYNSYGDMKTAGVTSVGGWNISGGAPVWDPTV